MTTERKPLSLFVKQKTPDTSKHAPTSADVKTKLMEVLDTLNDVTAVSALSKAIAQPGEQQGATSMPKPWEGITEIATAMGINLGEVWKERGKEVKDARETADGKDRDLHELRVQAIDLKVAELQKLMNEAKVRAEGNGGNPPAGRHAKVEDAIDSIIASKLDKILGGGNEQPQLTKEDIQRIAMEAAGAVAGQNSPEKMVATFMSFITAADAAKKQMVDLGGGQVNGNPYLNQAGSLRGDVLKILLENDLAKMKLQQDYGIQQERTRHLGALAGVVKDNIEDAIAASRDAVKDHRTSKGRGQEPDDSGEQGGFGVRCSECGQMSTYSEMPSGTFPCQQCGAQLQLQQEDSPQPPQPRQKTQQQQPGAVTGLEF